MGTFAEGGPSGPSPVARLASPPLVIEFSLMQPSKNTVFACFYALFDQYYVKRWDLKLIEIKLRKMDHIISISPKLSAYF